MTIFGASDTALRHAREQEKELCSAMSLEPLVQAVMLPCGHALNEEDVRDLRARAHPCPSCETPLEADAPMPAYQPMREAAARFARVFPDGVDAKKNDEAVLALYYATSAARPAPPCFVAPSKPTTSGAAAPFSVYSRFPHLFPRAIEQADPTRPPLPRPMPIVGAFFGESAPSLMHGAQDGTPEASATPGEATGTPILSFAAVASRNRRQTTADTAGEHTSPYPGSVESRPLKACIDSYQQMADSRYLRASYEHFTRLLTALNLYQQRAVVARCTRLVSQLQAHSWFSVQAELNEIAGHPVAPPARRRCEREVVQMLRCQIHCMQIEASEQPHKDRLIRLLDWALRAPGSPFRPPAPSIFAAAGARW